MGNLCACFNSKEEIYVSQSDKIYVEYPNGDNYRGREGMSRVIPGFKVPRGRNLQLQERGPLRRPL